MTPLASKLLAAISLGLDAKQILYIVDNNTATWPELARLNGTVLPGVDLHVDFLVWDMC